MTTPAANLPRTDTDYRSLLFYALGVVAVAVAIALALPLFSGSDGTPSATPGDATREWTRTETIDHLIRINGLAGGGAVTSSAAGSSVADQEATRDDVLDRLYRINGVTPPEAQVPAHVR